MGSSRSSGIMGGSLDCFVSCCVRVAESSAGEGYSIGCTTGGGGGGIGERITYIMQSIGGGQSMVLITFMSPWLFGVKFYVLSTTKTAFRIRLMPEFSWATHEIEAWKRQDSGLKGWNDGSKYLVQDCFCFVAHQYRDFVKRGGRSWALNRATRYL